MKTILTIVALLIAMIAVKTSNANSQEACSQGYVGCIDTCVKKPGVQDQCIALCQQRNDACASKVYGTPAPVAGGAQPKESGEAMDARDDGVAEAPKEAAKARPKAAATAKAPQKKTETR